MEWNVASNGSIDIKHGGIRFIGGFPAFDYQQIKPSKVTVQHFAKRIIVRYELENLQIELTAQNNNGGCSLETKLFGNGILPKMLYPLSGLNVHGANRFFKQGFGFAGPSGFVAIDENSETGSHESYLTTGFIDCEDNTLVFGATEHRNFLNRNTIYSRTHKNGLNENLKNRNELFLEIGFATENIQLNGELHLPTVYFLTGNKPYEVFEGFARMQAEMNCVPELKKRVTIIVPGIIGVVILTKTTWLNCSTDLKQSSLRYPFNPFKLMTAIVLHQAIGCSPRTTGQTP